jgi:UDP-glucose 4-epimerase
VVAIFSRQLLDGNVPTIHWDGKQTRDYVSVTDVARANLAAATLGDGACYSIATGMGTSVNKLYSVLCAIVGRSVEPNRAPRRPGDLRHAYFDCRRAHKDLKWQPAVELAEGLVQTVESFDRTLAGAVVGAR